MKKKIQMEKSAWIILFRIKESIDVEYVFLQWLDDLPEGFEIPEGRTKP